MLTAHHQDDQVENFLIRLFRGSGLTGLSSMSTKSNYNKNLIIIRPFLNFQKKDLVYSTKKIFKKYIIDPSNDNPIFLRSRIREYRKILDREGFDTKKIIKTVQNLTSAKNALQFYKREAINKNVKFTRGKCVVNLDLLHKEADEIVFRSVSDLFSFVSGSYYPPRSKKIVRLINLIKSKKNFTKTTLGGCIIEKSKNSILIKKEVIKKQTNMLKSL